MMDRDRFWDHLCDAADELPDEQAVALICFAEAQLKIAVVRLPKFAHRYRLKPWTAGSYAMSLLVLSTADHDHTPPPDAFQ